MTVGYSLSRPSLFSGVSSTGSYTTTGRISSSSLFNTEYLQKRNTYREKQEAYSIQQSGLDAALDQKVNKILSSLRSGHADKAMDAYNELLETMAAQERYSVIAEDKVQLKAIARQIIEKNMNENEGDLETLIRNKCDSNFQRGAHLNLDGDKYYENDLLLEMCDIDESNGGWDTAAEVGGYAVKGVEVVGGAAAGAAIGSAICPGVGTVVGGIIGGLIGLFS